jgi:hypothetical protein
MVIPVGVTLSDIVRQAQCRRRLRSRVSTEWLVGRDGLLNGVFPHALSRFFVRQRSVLISEAGIAGPALVYGLLRRFVTDQFELPDYPG